MGVPRSLINLNNNLTQLIKTKLWLQVIIAMMLGVIFGILIGPNYDFVSKNTAAVISGWVALPGQLFLLTIQFIVIPLIVASVIRGIAAGESNEDIGKLGFFTIIFFILTTIFAVTIGIALASLIQPGSFIDNSFVKALMDEGGGEIVSSGVKTDVLSLRKFPELLVGLFPKDPLTTFVSGNMLQTVISAAIIGIALVKMPIGQRKPILDLLSSVQSVCMVITGWVFKFVPIAVFGLMANISSKLGFSTLIAAGVYVLTVVLGLLMLLIIFTLIVTIVAKISPLVFLRNSREAILLAFSTSSSAAVMPLSLSISENKFNVRPGISRFVIPLGTTINMAGTALYQGVATLFLAQVFQIDIGLSGMILVVLMATGASIGSPGTPGIGIIVLATILNGVGIPNTGIALIIGVDRILDMCRTSVNVTGDIAATIVMNKLIKK